MDDLTLLVRIAPAGFGSVLLCGRRRLRLMLVPNSVIMGVAVLLFFA
jgi:hypothetical protein